MRTFIDPYGLPPINATETDEKPRCFVCQETFDRISAVDNHLFRIHSIEIATDNLSSYHYEVKQRVIR